MVYSSVCLCILLLQLLNSTHPSRIICLTEVPECFANLTPNSIREQLDPGRTLQQEIEVRIDLYSSTWHCISQFNNSNSVIDLITQPAILWLSVICLVCIDGDAECWLVKYFVTGSTCTRDGEGVERWKMGRNVPLGPPQPTRGPRGTIISSPGYKRILLNFCC